MADIFNEVDEEIRKEKAEKLWETYRWYVIGGALAIIVATAGVTFWKDFRKGQLEDAGGQFVQALELIQAGRSEAAAPLLAELAEDGPAGYSSLARFQEARVAAKAGDVAQAVAIYDAIAADSSVDEMLRDLAVLSAVLNAVDTGDPATLEAKLSPLTEPQNPWRYSAQELRGVLALKRGDSAAASETFKALVDDPKTPNGVRARASEIMAALGTVE